MYAAAPNVSDRIYQQIAPAIFGHADIKKAIACLLFGGTRKVREEVAQNRLRTAFPCRCTRSWKRHASSSPRKP